SRTEPLEEMRSACNACSGWSRKETANKRACAGLGTWKTTYSYPLWRGLGEKRRGKRFLRSSCRAAPIRDPGPPLIGSLIFLIPIPPVASSFSACRRALRRKRLGILLQNGGPIAVGYGSAGDCRHTFTRNQDAGQIKRNGRG